MHVHTYPLTRAACPLERLMNLAALRIWPARALVTLLLCGLGAKVDAVATGPAGNGIQLDVTLGNDLTDGACGTATSLDVTQLDQVNFCYVVSNDSTTTLNYQTLADDVAGTLLSAQPIAIAPGASYQYNRIIVARASQTPISTWTGYDVHPGYSDVDNAAPSDVVFSDGFDGNGGNGGAHYDFVDITATGTPLNMLGSGFPVNVGIGFPFTYYGETSDQVLVSLDGGVLFGVTTGYLPDQNKPLPDADLGAAILPYWTEIYYQQPEDGNTYVETLGTAPNRRFVVEWLNLPINVGGEQDGATFEAILYEGSNQILFEYADTDVGDPTRNDGITTTIGLNPPAGAEAALQYSYLQPSVEAGRAILFTPTEPMTYSAAQQVALNVGVPEISVNPASFDETVSAGQSLADTLDIGNVGNRDLDWTLTQVSTRAHFPPVSRFALPQGDPAASSAMPAPRPVERLPRRAYGSRAYRPLGGEVPAFGEEVVFASLVGLDAAHPQTLTQIAPNDLILTNGDFVDEDFSKLYGIDHYTYDLVTIDTTSGAVDVIGVVEPQPGAGIDWAGMSWDASTGTLYATMSQNTRDGLQAFLYKIDPVTAQATLVGPITGVGDADAGTLIIDIAVDTNGLMYGIDIVTDTLVAIDKDTAEASTIGSIGFDANYAQGLDFDDYTNTLYYAAYNASEAMSAMYTVDTDTGQTTLVGPISDDPSAYEIGAFAIARLSGACAYPNAVPWLSHDTGAGTTAPGETSPVMVNFDATALAAGVYTADICVFSNDRAHRRAAVPVTLTVQ